MYVHAHIHTYTRGVIISGGFCRNAEESLFEYETEGLYNGRMWKNISSVEGRSCDRWWRKFVRLRVLWVGLPLEKRTVKPRLAARFIQRENI